MQEVIRPKEPPPRRENRGDVRERATVRLVVDDMKEHIHRGNRREVASRESRVARGPANIHLDELVARELLLELLDCFRGDVGANHSRHAERMPLLDVEPGSAPDIEYRRLPPVDAELPGET